MIDMDSLLSLASVVVAKSETDLSRLATNGTSALHDITQSLVESRCDLNDEIDIENGLYRELHNKFTRLTAGEYIIDIATPYIQPLRKCVRTLRFFKAELEFDPEWGPYLSTLLSMCNASLITPLAVPMYAQNAIHVLESTPRPTLPPHGYEQVQDHVTDFENIVRGAQKHVSPNLKSWTINKMKTINKMTQVSRRMWGLEVRRNNHTFAIDKFSAVGVCEASSDQVP